MAIDEVWGDFGMVPLRTLTESQLRAGGVVAIVEECWGKEDPGAYSPLLLTGVPTESVVHESRQMVLRHTLIPVELCVPDGGSNALESGKFTARLIQDADALQQLDDIDGMSGGPIYGLRLIDGTSRYFVVGIQSGWLRSERIITFSAAAPILLQLRRELLERLRVKEASAATDPPLKD